MDGDTNSVDSYFSVDTLSQNQPWIYPVDFGIIKHITQVKLWTGNISAAHSYEIWGSQDKQNFTLIKSGILPNSPLITEKTIDFNGSYDVRYFKFITLDSWETFQSGVNKFSASQIFDINFFQCGVNSFYSNQIIPTADIITPVLYCANAISTDIQGVVNKYIPGLKDALKGAISVDADMGHIKGATHTLIPGDRILIIQMQNAAISDTNALAYGKGNGSDFIPAGWKDVKNTGEYEFAIVGSLSGNTIQLTQPLQKSYYADGVFQVVYCPIYDNVTLKGTIKAADWDGFCGGIVTFDARTLNLNNQTIDVSGQGFRKGNTNQTMAPVLYYWADYCTDNKNYFAEKGEGIAGAPRGTYVSNAKRLYTAQNASLKNGGSNGRGAPGNAGGGGAGCNSGGGGGANIGGGGQGGAAYGYTSSGDMTKYWNVKSPNGGHPQNPGYMSRLNGVPTLVDIDSAHGYYPNGGFGGTGRITPDAFRLWMGGAGGGGHQDTSTGTSGANGGGIIIATARVVKGQGNLLADGSTAQDAVMLNLLNDGAGGGGAGGSIVFGFDDQSGAKINYSTKGGNGGNIRSTELYGPGGGGGGGAIVVSAAPLGGSMTVTAGKNGIHVPTGSQWGADSGLDGNTSIVNNLSLLYTYSCDYGDAPVSFSDAAAMLKPDGPSLNAPGDAESKSLNQTPHDKDAKGDDLTGINDEDGIVQPFDTTLSTGQSRYKVILSVKNPQNVKVNLCGWIDFNCNGTFDDNEKVAVSGILNGPTDLVWTSFPSDITGGDSYLRFRVSTGVEALKPIGVAPDGEVEDYYIYINGFPAAMPDDTCTHSGIPVKISVVKNDNIHRDKRGKITILTPPTMGTAVTSNNNTPNDKTDDYITYTPNPGFQGVDTLTYELWNGVGNSAKAKVTITVKEPITVDFKPNPAIGCSPMTVNFTNLSSSKTAQFTWDFGDNSAKSNQFESQHVFLSGVNTSSYNVKLQMNTGCGIIETTQQILVNPINLAAMTLTSNEEKPEILTLSDMTPNDVSRIWTIDGLIVGTDSVMKTKIDSAGAHIIMLRAFNKLGCSDVVTQTHITYFKGLYVPNSFIPGSTNPSVNTFKPIGYGVKEYTLMIFDLWGNMIWSTSELNSLGQPLVGWDGKDKHGSPLPTDTYIWRITAVLNGNKPWKGMEIPLHSGSFHKEGTITIIR